MKVKHTHFFIRGGPIDEFDPHATYLCFAGRRNKVLIGLAGDDVRAHRDCLAGLLAWAECEDGRQRDGVLSDLLISDRPIRVYGVGNAYVFEELADEPV